MRRLPWQQSALEATSLAHILKLGGGVLVVGSSGQGREAFIERLARRILCLSPTSSDACGKCRSCLFTEHPDLHHVVSEDNKQIGIEPIRELSDKLHQTAQQSGERVAIVEPANRMTLSATNALLKTLEEPGQRTTLILGCDRISQVLPTIRSRCRIVTMPAATVEQCESWLAMQGYQSAQIDDALNASMGQPLVAEAMLESGGLSDYSRFISDLKSMSDATLDPAAFAQSWQKESALVMLGWWVQYLKNALLQAGRFEQVLLHRFYQQLVGQLRLVASPSNISPAMMLAELAISWFQLGRKVAKGVNGASSLHEQNIATGAIKS